MSHSQTEIIGFAEMVIDLLTTDEAMLTEAGLDVKKIRATLQRLLDETLQLAAEQESLKIRTVETTDKLNGTKSELYISVSGALDMAMGAAKKNSPTAKNYQRFRSRMRRPEHNSHELAQPVPEGT